MSPLGSFFRVFPAVVEQTVVGGAGQCEFVDVGQAAVGPFVDVVDLGEVSGFVASGAGAAAFLVVQHDPLISGRDAFGAAQPQRLASDPPVEEGQVVVGVAGHPDDVGGIGSRVPVPVAVTACPVLA